jgi:hypothetical protein
MPPSHSIAPPSRLEDLAWLIQAEFAEMPGMHLTFAQVKRLWNLSAADCQAVLGYLVLSGRLAQAGDDKFHRADS